MRSRISKAREPKSDVAPLDAVLRDDPGDGDAEDHEDPEIAVTRAEARARDDHKRVGTKKSSKAICSKRNYATALHRQADVLHHRGNYETALVLYHRAARAYPREASHGVAARRTALAISSATNPSRALRKVLSGAKNPCQLAANFCPETAALRARKIVEESSDPISSISQILNYLDSRKDFWRDQTTPRNLKTTSLVSRSNVMLKRLNQLASASLRDLQSVFSSGDFNKTLKIADELLVIADALPNRYRYQVAARHYLAMSQIALGRHDRAVDQVWWMVRLAGQSGDVGLRSKSFVTLGRVHLSNGHLDAAARAWERLVANVDEAVPKAWLSHEIGRCYFEMKSFGKALETAGRCIEYAEEVDSGKWLLHGKLLRGQSLVELGRYGEAVGPLTEAARAAADEKDSDTRDYVSNLIDRVTAALRSAVCHDRLVGRNAKSIDDNGLTAKVDETFKRAELTYRIEENNERRFSESTDLSEITKICDVESASRENTISRWSMTRRSKDKGQKGRRDSGGRENFRSSLSSPGIFALDLGNSDEQDINPSDPGTSRTPSFGKYSRADDLSSRLRYDDGDTENDRAYRESRSRRTETRSDGNSRKQSPGSDESEILVDDDGTSVIEEQRSDRTGKTYVLIDLSKKLTIDESFVDDAADDLDFYMENRFRDESEIIRNVDFTNDDKYLWNEKTNDSVIFPERARPYSERIDDGEEEEEEEGKRENERDEASFPNDREIFSSRESKLSGGSTGKTYVVDENKTMSLRETSGRNVDRPEATRIEKMHRSSSASGCSSRLDGQRRCDTGVGGDTVETMRDPSEKNDVARQINLERVGKLSSNVISTKNEEKSNVASTTSFSIGGCEMDFRGIPDTPKSHLATGESISVPRSRVNVSAAERRSLYRRSPTSSPRKELQLRSHPRDYLQ